MDKISGQVFFSSNKAIPVLLDNNLKKTTPPHTLQLYTES